MLRVLIILLLAANAVFFGWTRGWLDGVVGARSIGDREPERLQKQVRPELIRLLPADAASAASAASTPTASSPVSCLEAGPFADAQIAAVQSATQGALPAGSWVAVKSEQPGEWMIYMGRYATREAQLRKEDELKRRRLRFEEVRAPAGLAPGLALGRFDQRAGAQQALDRLAQQGVRTARVVELAPARPRTTLRVERADPTLAGRLLALRAEALGKGFVPCAVPIGT